MIEGDSCVLLVLGLLLTSKRSSQETSVFTLKMSDISASAISMVHLCDKSVIQCQVK